jgi:hypothetical protein
MIPMTVPTFSAVTSRKFGGGGAVLGWVYRSWRVAYSIGWHWKSPRDQHDGALAATGRGPLGEN